MNERPTDLSIHRRKILTNLNQENEINSGESKVLLLHEPGVVLGADGAPATGTPPAKETAGKLSLPATVEEYLPPGKTRISDGRVIDTIDRVYNLAKDEKFKNVRHSIDGTVYTTTNEKGTLRRMTPKVKGKKWRRKHGEAV
jgi:hypothetical protein